LAARPELDELACVATASPPVVEEEFVKFPVVVVVVVVEDVFPVVVS
jgi:hypothetical protein